MASSWALDSLTAWQPQDFFHDGLRLQSGSHIAFCDLALKGTNLPRFRGNGINHLLVLLQKSMWDRRYCYCCLDRASQVVLVVRNPPASAGEIRSGFHPWVGKIPWKRARQPTPVLLPGESREQRSLAGYGPWGRRVGDY